ncbi:MAG: hypothetical protein II968_00905 [Selenomonadaceae bacterium]|nr:hypothetical protein [Selenomonadaceae bacterium]
MTIDQLRRRAEQYDMILYKHTRGEDSYMLLDWRLKAVIAPAPMTLAEVEQWLDDLDKQQEIFDEEQEIFEQAKIRANETGEPQVIRYSYDRPPTTIFPDDD